MAVGCSIPFTSVVWESEIGNYYGGITLLYNEVEDQYYMGIAGYAAHDPVPITEELARMIRDELEQEK